MPKFDSRGRTWYDPVGATLLSGALPRNDLLTVPSNGARLLPLFI